MPEHSSEADVKKLEEDVYMITFDEFDRLVTEEFSFEYGKFECLAEFEWDNDANYYVRVLESDVVKEWESSFFIDDSYSVMKDAYDMVIDHFRQWSIGVHALMTWFVHYGILPAGHYIFDD